MMTTTKEEKAMEQFIPKFFPDKGSPEKSVDESYNSNTTQKKPDMDEIQTDKVVCRLHMNYTTEE